MGSPFKLKSGNTPSFKDMGAKKVEYSKEAKNLLKAVPNKEAYDKLSKENKSTPFYLSTIAIDIIQSIQIKANAPIKPAMPMIV